MRKQYDYQNIQIDFIEVGRLTESRYQTGQVNTKMQLENCTSQLKNPQITSVSFGI